jgi:hydroxymethylpyrimidine/phosphomethylpyrimidine kinase
LADARTIQALGGFAAMAVTAVTAQNTRGVQAWRPVPPGMIAAQIQAVMGDLRVVAIKTGLIPGAAAVRAIAEALEGHSRIPLVVDPVIGSTSGTRFLTTHGIRELKRVLLPHAALVTPNWPEAALLSGRSVGSLAEAKAAAMAIVELGCAAVLVKGGHAPGGVCPDLLAARDGCVRSFTSARIDTRNTHGTGCVLSAAIACGLAQGKPLQFAVAAARQFLRRALRAGRKERWGAGAGPALGRIIP